MRVLDIKRDSKGRFLNVWKKHRVKVICKCGTKFETVESRIKGGRTK